MVWKPGQSGNYSGRPRKYVGLQEAKVDDPNARNHFKAAITRDEYRYAAVEMGLHDPVEFQHKQMMNESLPMGLRVAIAANISHYCHPKLGVTAPPRFIETVVEVPEFKSIEQAESFLASLAQLFGSSELGSQSALDLSTLVRNWISAKHSAQELEIKRLAANDSNGDQVIRIEGGLPTLPGTDIIMPKLPTGPDVIEHPPQLADPAELADPVDPAESASAEPTAPEPGE
jgi:hypothetical protein